MITSQALTPFFLPCFSFPDPVFPSLVKVTKTVKGGCPWKVHNWFPRESCWSKTKTSPILKKKPISKLVHISNDSGRFAPDQVAGFKQNRWPTSSRLGGRIHRNRQFRFYVKVEFAGLIEKLHSNSNSYNAGCPRCFVKENRQFFLSMQLKRRGCFKLNVNEFWQVNCSV